MKVQIVIPKLGFVLLMVMLSLCFQSCKDRKLVRVPSSASIQKSPNNTANEQNPKPVLNPPIVNPSSNRPKIETPGSDPVEQQHSSDSDYSKTNGDDGNGGDHGGGVNDNKSDENSNDNISIQNKLVDNQPVLGGLHANTNANLDLVNNDQKNTVDLLNTTAGSSEVVPQSISPVSSSFQSSPPKSILNGVRGILSQMIK